MAEQRDVDRYLTNWRDEIESAALYRRVAQAEDQQQLAQVLIGAAVSLAYCLGLLMGVSLGV